VEKIWRDGRKVETFSALGRCQSFGAMLAGVVICCARLGAGVGGIAAPFWIELQPRSTLVTEAPRKSLSIAAHRKQVDQQDRKDHQMIERETNHGFQHNDLSIGRRLK